MKSEGTGERGRDREDGIEENAEGRARQGQQELPAELKE